MFRLETFYCLAVIQNAKSTWLAKWTSKLLSWELSGNIWNYTFLTEMPFNVGFIDWSILGIYSLCSLTSVPLRRKYMISFCISGNVLILDILYVPANFYRVPLQIVFRIIQAFLWGLQSRKAQKYQNTILRSTSVNQHLTFTDSIWLVFAGFKQISLWKTIKHWKKLRFIKVERFFSLEKH